MIKFSIEVNDTGPETFNRKMDLENIKEATADELIAVAVMLAGADIALDTSHSDPKDADLVQRIHGRIDEVLVDMISHWGASLIKESSFKEGALDELGIQIIDSRNKKSEPSDKPTF